MTLNQKISSYFFPRFLKCKYSKWHSTENGNRESKMLPTLTTLMSNRFTKTHQSLHLSWPCKPACRTWNQHFGSLSNTHSHTWADMTNGWDVSLKVTSEETVMEEESITFPALIFPQHFQESNRCHCSYLDNQNTKRWCPVCSLRAHTDSPRNAKGVWCL